MQQWTYHKKIKMCWKSVDLLDYRPNDWLAQAILDDIDYYDFITPAMDKLTTWYKNQADMGLADPRQLFLPTTMDRNPVTGNLSIFSVAHTLSQAEAGMELIAEMIKTYGKNNPVLISASIGDCLYTAPDHTRFSLNLSPEDIEELLRN
jgi:hypothetical protein